jgi:hypothetical protein
MENTKLYEISLEGIISNIKLVEDEKVEINYGDNINILVETYHEQDCCENVYADFSIMKNFIEQLKDEYVSKLIIKGVKDMGFLLCFERQLEDDIKIFIPCYNSQNGYYSSDLSLKLKCGEVTTEIDISSYVEDKID